MPTIPAADQAVVRVHVLSGQEQKVAKRIRSLASSRRSCKDKIFEVLVPTEMVSEVKRGKKTETKRKFYPGYIIVNMNLFTTDNDLVEETWYFIKEMDGVIGFAGTKEPPDPDAPARGRAMLAQIKEREDRSARRSVSRSATP